MAFQATVYFDTEGIFFLESLKSPDHWLISDLIPKKSEKFESRKNFVTIFVSVKN